MDLLSSKGSGLAFVAADGAVYLRRGIHLEPLVIRGEAAMISHASSVALPRTMLSIALDDPEPDATLVRAFATDVVSRLPRDGFELTHADIVAWVESLGSAQHDDLRQEQRPLRLDELAEYQDIPDDPANQPVLEAGGGVAEGFEAAEDALIAHATHAADSGGDPLRDAFPPEPEADAAGVVYGEANAATGARREDPS